MIYIIIYTKLRISVAEGNDSTYSLLVGRQVAVTSSRALVRVMFQIL